MEAVFTQGQLTHSRGCKSRGRGQNSSKHHHALRFLLKRKPPEGDSDRLTPGVWDTTSLECCLKVALVHLLFVNTNHSPFCGRQQPCVQM